MSLHLVLHYARRFLFGLCDSYAIASDPRLLLLIVILLYVAAAEVETDAETAANLRRTICSVSHLLLAKNGPFLLTRYTWSSLWPLLVGARCEKLISLGGLCRHIGATADL